MNIFDDWINKHRPDCEGLDDSLKTAVAHFVLIWSFFEESVLAEADKRMLTRNAAEGKPHDVNNSRRIAYAAEHCLRDFTKENRFSAAYDFFRNRHLDGASISSHLEELMTSAGQMRARIEGIYRDNEAAEQKPHLQIEAMLLVAYYLRTNLIHGYKWISGLANQVENFNHASLILMLAVDHLELATNSLEDIGS